MGAGAGEAGAAPHAKSANASKLRNELLRTHAARTAAARSQWVTSEGISDNQRKARRTSRGRLGVVIAGGHLRVAAVCCSLRQWTTEALRAEPQLGTSSAGRPRMKSSMNMTALPFALLVSLAGCTCGPPLVPPTNLTDADHDASSDGGPPLEEDGEVDSGVDGGRSACIDHVTDGGELWDIYRDPIPADASRAFLGRIVVAPNQMVDLILAESVCCYMLAEPENVCTIWSVRGTDLATIRGPGGPTATLSVGDLPPGSEFVVSALMGGYSTEVRVSIANPSDPALVGVWTESRRLDCASSELPIGSYEPIRELRFSADNQFLMTWTPFERFVDIWGAYDARGGRLTLLPSGGNTLDARWNADTDLEAAYEISAGELHVRDAELSSPAACEHVFRRLD